MPKNRKEPKPKWRITIYEHGKETRIDDIPTSSITESDLVSLLKMLYAKLADLSDRELVEMHLRKKRGRQNHAPVYDRTGREKHSSYQVGEPSLYTHAVLLWPSDPLYDASEWQDSDTLK